MFTLIWLMLLGCAVGSFLNVVIYRLPAGKSLVYPGSHCPQCQHALAIRDNVPVLSWFLLRGRCRYCQLPIPFRYPLVEAMVGALFVLLAWQWLLPHDIYDGDLVLPSFPVDAWCQWGYVTCLACLLIATAWMEQDGHGPHWRLIGLGCAAATIMLVINTSLAVSGAPGTLKGATLGVSLAGLMAGVTLVANGQSWSPLPRDSQHLLASMGMVGWSLGWEAVALGAIVAAIIQAISTICFRGFGTTWPGRFPLGWSGVVATVTIGLLIAGPRAMDFGGSMSVVSLFAMLAVSLLTRLVKP